MEREKNIDETWKEAIMAEKDSLKYSHNGFSSVDSKNDLPAQGDASAPEVNFINYIISLTLQALIFLGEVPHPLEQDNIEISLPQAKLIIDTLIVIREKTKGNLTLEENKLLDSSIYELQVKYVEVFSKQGEK